MTSDGMPWRPLVHVRDIGAAVAATLGSAARGGRQPGPQCGRQRQQLPGPRESPRRSGEAFPNCKIEFGSNSGDNRSYRVAFDKIKRVLPGFRCEWNAQPGRPADAQPCSSISPWPTETSTPRLSRACGSCSICWRTQQIDPDFYWRDQMIFS